MRRFTTTIGIGIVFSVVLILLSGFLARSSTDMLLIVFGFAMGMLAVYANDRLKASKAASVQIARDQKA